MIRFQQWLRSTFAAIGDVQPDMLRISAVSWYNLSMRRKDVKMGEIGKSRKGYAHIALGRFHRKYDASMRIRITSPPPMSMAVFRLVSSHIQSRTQTIAPMIDAVA